MSDALNSIDSITDELRRELEAFKRPKKILFVEDDHAMHILLARRTEHFNCELFYAEEGAPAVAMARETEFDLIIMDIGLPGGMNGIEAFREIKKIRQSARVAIFTGSVNNDIARETETIGFAPIIKKPFNPSTKFFDDFMDWCGIQKKEEKR